VINKRALEKTENATKKELYKDTGNIGHYTDRRQTKQKTQHRKLARCVTRAQQNIWGKHRCARRINIS
jgi:hypothetical protein